MCYFTLFMLTVLTAPFRVLVVMAVDMAITVGVVAVVYAREKKPPIDAPLGRQFSSEEMAEKVKNYAISVMEKHKKAGA
jgi:hypothetical protein